MKQFLIASASLLCFAEFIAVSINRKPTRTSTQVNPYFEKYLKSVEACERGNQEWREAEDRARQDAWQKYGKRESLTGLGQNDCKAEAWASLDYLPFNERVEARKQIEIALKESAKK